MVLKVLLVLFIILLILAAAVAIWTYEFTYVNRMSKRFDPLIINDSDKEYYGEMTEEMASSVKRMDEAEKKHVFIRSFDGLRLNGHLIDDFPGRPLVIFCHGYHGSYLRDGYGTFRYCMEHQLNLLMIEERSHCKSDGKVITFGVYERRDVTDWVKYAKEIMPEGTKIILSGVSMGAATVMMSSDLLEDEESVIAYIEDCGYTSPKAIICNSARSMGFPAGICYQLCKMLCVTAGRFNPDSAAAIDSVSKITKPMLFIHGKCDSFVPTAMCPELFDACSSQNKQITLIPGAKHAIAALTDYVGYEAAITSFLKSVDPELV